MDFMKLAIDAANKAKNEGNVPVGCVIVKNNEVISASYNKKNSLNVSIYHAEILAIIEACEKLKSWYLDDCELYVTLKPCLMCSSAIAESRIKKVYYLLDSNYNENMNSNINNIIYIKMIDKYEHSSAISDFFNSLR